MAEEEDKLRSIKDTMEQGRSRKLTEKALQERLQRCIAQRRKTLGTLTSIGKEIETMKSDVQNVQRVKNMMENEFAKSLKEFNQFNNEVSKLLTEDEKGHDQENWFEPKMAKIRQFMKMTKNWIAAEDELILPMKRVQQEESNVDDYLQETVKPDDSVSQVGVRAVTDASARGSQVSRSSAVSRVSSTRARQEAEHAALLERAATLRKMQQLEFEAARIKAEKEELELETALAESKAKIRVLKEYERSEDGFSSYAAMQKPRRGHEKERTSIILPQQANTTTHVQPQPQHSRPHQQCQPVSNYVPNAQPAGGDNILAVMQKQNVITELLVKQQQLSHLPTKDIPVFKGDALQYKSFMRAFEHALEQKTSNDQDNLYFLEQFTAGVNLKSLFAAVLI